MDTAAIARKIGLADETLAAIMADLEAEPALPGSPEDLHALLFEVLGVLTGDSKRDEFPRTEVDRAVYKIARPHLEPPVLDGLASRLAWGSLWLNLRQLTTAV